MKKLEHLAITCGGTGGHFNPGLSVAQELNARGGEAILLVGGKRAEQQIALAAECGVKAFRISAEPKPGNPLRVWTFLRALYRGWKESRALFRTYRVQALLSMGNYTSLPPILAARLTMKKSARLPFFLHDGNARLGKANLLTSRFAVAFAFSFPAVNSDAVKCPAVLTGFPLRAPLLHANRTRGQAIAEINERFHAGFDPAQPLLLVFGGSLGAEKINSNIAFGPGAEKIQVIHLAGPGKQETAKRCYENLPNRVLVLESFEDIALLYAAADAVVSRAGGGTVSELAYFGKYALLVPYPFAAQHHQDDNAAWLASAGGAEVVPDAECTKTFFASTFARWAANFESVVAAGEANRALAMPAAASNVIAMIEKYL